LDPILPRSARLTFAPLTLDDADFIVELLNDPDFRRHIGDRGVREAADVAGYLSAGPWRSYAENRFGLLKISETASGVPVGMAGLIRRPTLDDVDLGYALLRGFRGRGYVTEACGALIRLAADAFGLTRLVAIVAPDNAASIGALERVGFRFERMLPVGDGTPDVGLYARAIAPSGSPAR
jgi:[ribosomal protein S5]-alanine N-acetyltransferase